MNNDELRKLNALEHTMRYGDPGGVRRGMRKVYYDYKDIFRHYTDVPLSQYFSIDRGGFQAQAFTVQILDYAGPVPGVACAKMFGKSGQNMIANMMHDCAKVMNDPDPGG